MENIEEKEYSCCWPIGPEEGMRPLATLAKAISAPEPVEILPVSNGNGHHANGHAPAELARR